MYDGRTAQKFKVQTDLDVLWIFVHFLQISIKICCEQNCTKIQFFIKICLKSRSVRNLNIFSSILKPRSAPNMGIQSVLDVLWFFVLKRQWQKCTKMQIFIKNCKILVLAILSIFVQKRQWQKCTKIQSVSRSLCTLNFCAVLLVPDLDQYLKSSNEN